ncbi:DMT family transporter [Sphingomonas flavalba]|uniref:DMT family transporter n=1 Tax=Sphingomonas flavalba TaxID=2559804 RepID=UPI00109DA9DA|nr:DMT family transporter [Sphingomonas flavalba]
MSPPRPAPPVIAFAVASIGVLSFSGMDAAMKQLSLDIGLYNAVLWRSLVGIAIGIGPFLVARRGWPAPQVLRLHVLRGLVAGLSVLLFFWGLARMPLAPAIALTFVAPLITLFLAALLLGEAVGAGAVIGSLVAFSGVLTIVAGELRVAVGPEVLWAALAILGAATLYAYNLILMRRQAQLAGPVEVAFFLNLTLGVCMLVAAPIFFERLPPIGSAPLIGVAALLSFGSLMLLSWAYARAEASYLSAVEYTAFIWACLLGYWIFDETLGMLTVAGAGLIVAGCLVVARRPAAGTEVAL